MAVLCHGVRRNKRRFRYPQWKLSTWHYPTHHANCWLTSRSSTQFPSTSTIRRCTRTTKRQKLSSNANQTIKGQSTSIFDTISYEITTNAEASTSNTYPRICNSQTSSRNPSHVKSTKTSSMRCVLIKEGFSAQVQLLGSHSSLSAPVRDFLPF